MTDTPDETEQDTSAAEAVPVAEAAAETPGVALARKLSDTYQAFAQTTDEVERDLAGLVAATRQRVTDMGADYAAATQAAGSNDDLARAYTGYAAAVAEVQKEFEDRWTKECLSAAESKIKAFETFTAQVRTAWREVEAETLTPADALWLGQHLLCVSTLAQMYDGLKQTLAAQAKQAA